MSTATPKTDSSNALLARRYDTMVSLAMLSVIVVLIIPLPSVLLDMLLAFNLASSILLLLITLSARQPLEISVFPSLLLLLTLYRLSLNVATTRLILLNGDAGKIVSTFGNFVVGGSLTVGVVVFLILVIIQFIVITKGASRISEVNARFVLDAMPGKQMAIDAELGAGSISDEEAKRRRGTLTREAEFYGAMDGAGKYVRGDAIAGLIITVVNIVGGIVFGMSKGMSFNGAVELYSTLTIGDGLLSQIPALVIATTAGLLVTKASSDTSIGHEVGEQMLAKRHPLMLGAGIMCAIALTPGLPKIPFIGIAMALFFYARRVGPATAVVEPEPPAPRPGDGKPDLEETGLDHFINTDRIRVEIGPSLIPMTAGDQPGTLPARITNMRQELARKYGMWIPIVRLRDNVKLGAMSYRIFVNGRSTGDGEIRPGRFLAINPGTVTLPVEGEEAIEPAFGLKALWIPASAKQRAELGGYTVVDAATVLVTHLGELLRRHANELLSREDLQKMLNRLRESSPTIVDEIKPDVVRPATLRKVLTNLLSERVSISSFELILESVVHHGPGCKDPDLLTERVREDIGQIVCDRFRNADGKLQVVVIDPKLESRLRDSLNDEGRLVLPGAVMERLAGTLRQHWQPIVAAGREVALMVDGSIRRQLRECLTRLAPEIAFIAYAEVPQDLQMEPCSLVRMEEVYPLSENSDTPPAAASQTPNPVSGHKAHAA